MNKEEAKNLAIYCAKLWPNQVTQELSALAVKRFLAHEAKLARKAIEQHRAEPNGDSFLNWGRLFDAVQLAERSADLKPKQSQVMSFADMQRQISPCLHDMNDPQVTLCHFRHQWRIALGRNPHGVNLPEKPTETQRQHAAAISAYRSSIGNSCTMLLMSAGMTKEDAPKWTETVFEPSVEYFRQVIDELSSWQGRAALNQVEQELEGIGAA